MFGRVQLLEISNLQEDGCWRRRPRLGLVLNSGSTNGQIEIEASTRI